MDESRPEVRESFRPMSIHDRSAMEESARSALVKNKPQAKTDRPQKNAYLEVEFLFMVQTRAGLGRPVTF